MYKIAVMASTRGTDLQAMIDEINAGTLDVEISCVIANVEDCGALKKARMASIPDVFVDPKGLKRETFDKKVAEVIDFYEVDLIVLVGYMRILSPWFVQKYPKKIISVHPSLLPEFPGMDLNVHAEVLKAGKKKSGMTIHYVDEGMDTGGIILQKSCPVTEDDTIETLKAKVQDLEKKWYPEVIRRFSKGEIT